MEIDTISDSNDSSNSMMAQPISTNEPIPLPAPSSSNICTTIDLNLPKIDDSNTKTVNKTPLQRSLIHSV